MYLPPGLATGLAIGRIARERRGRQYAKTPPVPNEWAHAWFRHGCFVPLLRFNE